MRWRRKQRITACMLTLAISTALLAAPTVGPPPPGSPSPCKAYTDVIDAQDEAIRAAEQEIAALRAALEARKAEAAELRAAVEAQREVVEMYRLMYAAEVAHGKAQERRMRWLRGMDSLRWFGVGFVGGYAVNEAVGP